MEWYPGSTNIERQRRDYCNIILTTNNEVTMNLLILMYRTSREQQEWKQYKKHDPCEETTQQLCKPIK